MTPPFAPPPAPHERYGIRYRSGDVGCPQCVVRAGLCCEAPHATPLDRATLFWLRRHEAHRVCLWCWTPVARWAFPDNATEDA
jgi:hypothetical protein